MSTKFSTGLRNALLVTGSFKNQMDGSVLKIYAGDEPATADAAIGGATLLCTISDDATGDGLTFATTAAAGVVTKTLAQIWRGINAATGVATFFRFEHSGDDQGASTTHRRVQGSIAVAGAELNLSNTSLTSAAPQLIDYLSVALPTA